MSDLLQLAEVVLARFGPIMVECGGCNDGTWPAPGGGRVKCIPCGGTGTRPITAAELSAPDGDRPNAHVDRLFWSGDFGTLLHTKHGWRGHGWAGDHLMDGPWCAPRHQAQLAALAGAPEDPKP